MIGRQMKLLTTTKKSTKTCKSMINKAFGGRLPHDIGWIVSTAGNKRTWILISGFDEIAKIINYGEKREIYIDTKYFKIKK